MPYTGITQAQGICAICTKSFPKGALVYFDASKPQGRHLVHKLCYDVLRASRDTQPAPGKAVQSSERLDPPF